MAIRLANFVIVCLSLLALNSCQSGSSNGMVEEQADTLLRTQPRIAIQEEETFQIIEKDGLQLLPVQEEVKYSNAQLMLLKPSLKLEQANMVQFEFQIEGFELGVQTEGDRARLLANSEQGQHIHFIHNNGPYEAHYTSSFESNLGEGNNVILAFLSRSYHESVKEQKAFVFKNISVGVEGSAFDEQAPHLIYSRPKGSYQGRIDKILLDFFLINATLSEKGMKVKVTIDQTDFMLSSWQPYLVEGLSPGEHKFRIQLVDQSGNVVPGPFNDSGERVVTLIQ